MTDNENGLNKTTSKLNFSKWWNTFELAERQLAYWQIGPLQIWLLHEQNEWSLRHLSLPDPFCAESQIEVSSQRTVPAELHTQRFAIRQRNSQVRLTPRCPDRPMISRPSSPFSITAKERVTLYLSTPVWVSIEVGSPARSLLDIPTYRPSDTWFGPDTLQGELCYASRLQARFHADEIQWTPHRAITSVEIINSTKTAILLERLCLPLPHFSIYSNDKNFLWTQSATLELTGEDGLAHLRIHRLPPTEAGQVQRLSPAREPISDNFMFRAISALFPNSGNFL